jgi:geranylgeranyl reductase family protein
MQIAIVGGGPAGCWASILLARLGHNVNLVDSQAPWEKPCGGGITTKALARFGIFATDLPRTDIETITIFFGNNSSVSLKPMAPLAVVSRRELGKYLLDEAQSAGVTVIHDRVTHIERRGRFWRIRARQRELEAEYLVGADGATSIVRRAVGRALPPEDLCVTLGYFIPGATSEHMKVFFVPSLEGYIWSFPRLNHVSYGLITRSGPNWNVRAKTLLSNFIIADLGADVMQNAEFYSAPVPCLRPRSWKDNAISGDGWGLIGDAAGLADPITAEGIYFAFRSAEILAETIEKPSEYSKAIWNDMGRELARAAHMYRRFYRGRFWGTDFRKRTVQLAGRSRTVRQILGNLIAGNQSYLNLKKTMFLSIPSVGWDLVSGRR